jgi:hemerythrin-like domain-containing protein
MSTIKNFLAADHHHCDDLFAAAEVAAAGKNWSSAESSFLLFRDALQHHFTIEEEVMFPAFEDRTGSSMGPTQMMRVEHGQMKELLEQMERGVASRDSNAFLGDCETLLIIMQQHNIKEEQMLYPMADNVLAGECEVVVGRMRAVA